MASTLKRSGVLELDICLVSDNHMGKFNPQHNDIYQELVKVLKGRFFLRPHSLTANSIAVQSRIPSGPSRRTGLQFLCPARFEGL